MPPPKHANEVVNKLNANLNKCFSAIAATNFIVRQKIQNGTEIAESLAASPDNCKMFTQSVRTFQFTKDMSERMGLKDMIELDQLVIKALKEIHENSTNIHEKGCATNIETE